MSLRLPVATSPNIRLAQLPDPLVAAQWEIGNSIFYVSLRALGYSNFDIPAKDLGCRGRGRGGGGGRETVPVMVISQ